LPTTLIRARYIITMNDQAEILAPGYIAIADSEIASVSAHPPAGKYDLELGSDDVVALPGLVNAHTHVAMTLMRGYADDMQLMPWLEQKIWPREMKLRREDIYWGSLLGMIEMLRAGVTTFNDMYWWFDATAQAAHDCGIRASLSAVLLGFMDRAEGDLANAAEFAARWKNAADGRITVMLGPHAPYTVPDSIMRCVIETGRDLGIGVHIHLAETAREVKESLDQTGLTPVAHMERIGLFDLRPVLAAHCVHVTDDDIARLGRHRVGVSHNPGSNLKLASGIMPLPKMLEAGVSVGLGTDGAASNNNLDVLEETRLAALVHKLACDDPTCVTAYQALGLATRGGARALGLHDRIGVLAPGMKADIILVDLRQPHLTPLHNVVSNLVYSARACDVRTVLVNGAVVVNDGKVTTVSQDEVMARASERVQGWGAT
jgi:5-methylthioadenosine/S-adenosylhomocysteine deaminase